MKSSGKTSNLLYLKTFVEVVKLRSFSKVAKSLGVSQPTISFQIQRLEQEYGTRLMERQGRGISLTEPGREYHLFAQRVLAEQEALHRRLASLQEQVSGTLTLCASTIPGEFLLPRILGDFRQRHPAVEATIAITDSADVVDKVAERQCDVGFLGVELKRRGLVLCKICDDPLVLVAPCNHPFSQRAFIKLEEMDGQPLVQREEGSGTQRNTEILLRQAGFSLARVTCPLRVTSPQAILSSVEAGVGLAFVSQLSAVRHLESKKVTQVSLEGTSFSRGIYYTYLEKREPSKLVQTVLDFLATWQAN